MQLEFPYQIVTFLGKEPTVNETVYYGKNGWYPQVALKRRFKLNQTDEDSFVVSLKSYFNQLDSPAIITGSLVKPERIPVQVIDIVNQNELKKLHTNFIESFRETITSRYPDREGQNYYAHITAEFNNDFVITVEAYTNKAFALDNVWLLKDRADENSQAYLKIK